MMRESSFSSVAHNRAAVTTSSSVYDRRSIDSPLPTLPLVCSLTHLSYLTSTSPRIRDILAVDGGLERLVRIAAGCIARAREPTATRQRGGPFRPFACYAASHAAQATTGGVIVPTSSTPDRADRALVVTFTLALQSLVNVGVRGSEQIRTRVVEAGVLSVATAVMRAYLDVRAPGIVFGAHSSHSHTHAAASASAPALTSSSDLALPLRAPQPQHRPVGHHASGRAPPTRTNTPDAMAALETDDNDAEAEPSDPDEASTQATSTPLTRVRSNTLKSHAESDADAMDVDLDGGSGSASSASASSTGVPAPQKTPTPAPSPAFQFRDDDVLMCLQLLAYLSKYPHVRAVFHAPDSDASCGARAAAPSAAASTTAAPSSSATAPAPASASISALGPRSTNNVFSLVERFTFRPSPADRTAPRFAAEIGYWAGVIMRNACRKDEARGGIRQCANMLCGAWERFPREFAKCRRCRKAKYCSKTCQSAAWQGGHRYWCSIREAAEHLHGPSRARAAAAEAQAEAAANGHGTGAHSHGHGDGVDGGNGSGGDGDDMDEDDDGLGPAPRPTAGAPVPHIPAGINAAQAGMMADIATVDDDEAEAVRFLASASSTDEAVLVS